MQVTIRPAGPSDAEAAVALYLRSREAAALAKSIPPLAHSDHDVRNWMCGVVIPKLEVWLAEHVDGEIVGMLVLQDEWIDQLYVDPDFTGVGIGTQMLDLAKRARPRGLRLWTFVSNAGAQRFYERNGFTEVERTDGGRNEERAPDIQYRFLPT
jgi:ribosomal protein S18 acetylase RimI-like enzyme